jgi:hypothetical protein
LPNSISNIQDFLLILQSLDELNFCNGIRVTKFEDVLCDDFKNGIYMKYDKYLGPVHDNVLKSFNCLEAISSMSQSNCLHCFELKSYLYHLRSRIKLQKSNPDWHINTLASLSADVFQMLTCLLSLHCKCHNG